MKVTLILLLIGYAIAFHFCDYVKQGKTGMIATNTLIVPDVFAVGVYIVMEGPPTKYWTSCEHPSSLYSLKRSEKFLLEEHAYYVGPLSFPFGTWRCTTYYQPILSGVLCYNYTFVNISMVSC